MKPALEMNPRFALFLNVKGSRTPHWKFVPWITRRWSDYRLAYGIPHDTPMTYRRQVFFDAWLRDWCRAESVRIGRN